MKLNKLSQVLLAAACFASAAAHADVKTYTSTPVANSPTDLTEVLSFQQFDSSLGTLQSISITVASKIDAQISITDLILSSHAPQYVSAKVGVELFLQRPTDGSNILQLSEEVLSGGITLHGNDSGVLHKVWNVTGSQSLGAADFGLFTGGGYVYAPFQVNALSSWSGDDADVEFTTYATGSASITYNYIAAVPEPETYGMMLLGMGVVAFAARRKSRSAQA